MKKQDLRGGLKDLGGGFNALFERSDISPINDEPQAPADEVNTPQEEESEQDRLIAGVSDEELRAKLQANKVRTAGRPKRGHQQPKKIGNGYSHACYTLSDETQKKIRALAVREGFNLSEVVEEALKLAIRTYEEAHRVELTAPTEKQLSKLFK